MAMPDDNKLTIAQIVEKTGAKRSTVNRWCRKGKFPNAELIETPVNSYWLIPETDLHAVESELKAIKMGRPRKED